MDNINKTLKVIFEFNKPDIIIKSVFTNSVHDYRKNYVSNFDSDEFKASFSFNYPQYYSYDEIDNLKSLMKSEWLKFHEVKTESLFNILLHFSYNNVLLEINDNPYVEYQELLKWRDIAFLLGEDIFTTSFLAYKDLIVNRQRTYFSWDPIITSNNYRLKKILEKGLAENHFHLKGSAPHFNLSWLSLMNDVINRDKEFRLLEKEKKQTPNISYDYVNNKVGFHYLAKKAGAIRLLLFWWVNLRHKHNRRWQNEGLDQDSNEKGLFEGVVDISNAILKSESDDEISLHMNSMQRYINELRYYYGRKFGDEVPDYAIPRNISDVNFRDGENRYNGFILFYGEKNFMYLVFQEIYSGTLEKENVKYRDLFYSYLLIKTMMMKEFNQVNNRVGFSNFDKYQNRKDYFIKTNSIYEKAIYSLAIKMSLMNNKSVNESRIAPKETTKEYIKTISKIDSIIKGNSIFYEGIDLYNRILYGNQTQSLQIGEYFYGIHFIKSKDKSMNIDNLDKNPLTHIIQPRNYKTRIAVESQAKTLVKFKNLYSSYSGRIRMIDAANLELGCRPEVFAQAFRFLRQYRNKTNPLINDQLSSDWNLWSSFHVGEDFVDIVDGLRAIEEARIFLNLGEGDRIGHAIALGIDPSMYYKTKDYTLVMSRQDLIDNIAWFLNKCRKYNISLSGTRDFLIWEFEKHFNYVYSNIYREIREDQINKGNMGSVDNKDVDGIKSIGESENIDCLVYYDAWKLRGDNPHYYLEHRNDGCEWDDIENLTFWNKCALNKLPKGIEEIRKPTRPCVRIFHDYHYNVDVKKKGLEVVEFKIKPAYMEAVRNLQDHMQMSLAKKRIGIETNPSSNYVISNFKCYEKHPIIRFYNLGLTYDPISLNKCAQLFVSINTDDQGVFGTNIENEYAYVSLALEQAKDENGEKIYNQAMIYDWIERIRQMGMEQSFYNRI